MQLELTNSNHNSESETSEWARAPMAAVAAGKAVVVASSLWRSVVMDAAALREMRALAGAGLLGPNVTKPPRLWTVADMAKQLALSPAAVRRRARQWAFTRCVAHQGCHGGGCGCDLRFIAKEADAWVNSQRRRAAR